MNRRVVVYAATRNLYKQMYVSLTSLLKNNEIDAVCLLIEDNDFPYELPENVYCINVSGQDIFPADGANSKTRYTYMSLMRCALPRLFPKEKRMLWLDVDTIVDGNICDLFDLNMDEYCYAGAVEPNKSIDVFQYINDGVLLVNLECLRQTGRDDEIIEHLNRFPLKWPDQEAINIYCQGKIRVIGNEYNSNCSTGLALKPKIWHFAAIKDWTNYPMYKKYEKEIGKCKN